MSFFRFSDKSWDKFSLVIVSPVGIMLDFKDQKVPTWPSGRAQILLFTEGPAAHNTLDTLSWFSVVSTYIW